MGPPISTWPYSHPRLIEKTDKVQSEKCLLVTVVDNLRVIGLNFTVAFLIIHVFSSLSTVAAGPVILSLNYLQGKVFLVFTPFISNYRILVHSGPFL